MVARVAKDGRGEPERAGPGQRRVAADVQTVAPVARAAGAELRQAAGLVKHDPVGVGERIPQVRDLAREPARGGGQREHGGDRDQRQHRDERGSDLPPARLGHGRACEQDGHSPAGSDEQYERDEQHDREAVAGGDPRRQRGVIVGERRLVGGPQRRDRAPEHARDEHEHAAQPHRHPDKPDRQRDHRGADRAAPVGEDQRAHERAERRSAGGGQQPRGAARGLTPGAQPRPRRNAHRRDQPGGVVVVKRRPHACQRVSGVQRAREHLGRQRVDRHDHGVERDAADDRRAAIGGQARQRHRRREGGEVGQRAVGLHPRERGLDRPGDRGEGQRRQRAEHHQGQRGRSPGMTVRRAHDRDRDAEAGGERDQRDLGPGVRAQRNAASGGEGQQGERGGNREPEQRIALRTPSALRVTGPSRSRAGPLRRGSKGRHGASLATGTECQPAATDQHVAAGQPAASLATGPRPFDKSERIARFCQTPRW